jgi:hypothetical protein
MILLFLGRDIEIWLLMVGLPGVMVIGGAWVFLWGCYQCYKGRVLVVEPFKDSHWLSREREPGPFWLTLMYRWATSLAWFVIGVGLIIGWHGQAIVNWLGF